MNVFKVTGPQTITFENDPAKDLIIYRQPGNIYHAQKSGQNKVSVKFPLPGLYSCFNPVIETKQGISKPLGLLMPRGDRNYNLSKFHVVYNPDLTDTPARVFYEIGRCEIGPKFYDLPLQWQTFILEHEKGHFSFSDELGADRWAFNSFMAKGYNCSQAFYALDSVLKRNQENIKRIQTHFKLRSNEN